MKKILRSIVLSLVLLFVGIISLASCGDSEQLKSEVVEKLKEEYSIDEVLATELYKGIDVNLIREYKETYPEDYETRVAEEYIKKAYPEDYEEGVIAIIKTETLSRLTVINKETKEKILVIEGIFNYMIRKDGVVRFDYFGTYEGAPRSVQLRIYYKNCEPEILHPYADSEDEKLRNRLYEEINDFSAGKDNAFPTLPESYETEYVKIRYGRA